MSDADWPTSVPTRLCPFYTTAELLCSVLATLGNSVILYLVFRRRALRQSIKNAYVASLAIADLLVALVGIPFALITYVGLPTQFEACLVTNSALLIFCTASITSLLAVTVDRFWAITRPLTYSVTMTPFRAGVVIASAWALALLIGMLPLLGWNKGRPPVPRCFFMEIVGGDYLAFICFGTIVGPSIIIAIFNILIFRSVRKQGRYMLQLMVRRSNLTVDSQSRTANAALASAAVFTTASIVVAAAPRNVRIADEFPTETSVDSEEAAVSNSLKELKSTTLAATSVAESRRPTTTAKRQGPPAIPTKPVVPRRISTATTLESNNETAVILSRLDQEGDKNEEILYSDTTKHHTDTAPEYTKYADTNNFQIKPTFTDKYQSKVTSVTKINNPKVWNSEKIQMPSGLSRSEIQIQESKADEILPEMQTGEIQSKAKAGDQLQLKVTTGDLIKSNLTDDCIQQDESTPAAETTTKKKKLLGKLSAASCVDIRENRELKHKQQQLRIETRAVQSIALLVLTFIASWLPLYALNTYDYFCSLANPYPKTLQGCVRPPSLAFSICIILSHYNSVWNPFLYAWGMRDIRRELRALIWSRKKVGLVEAGGMTGLSVGLATLTPAALLRRLTSRTRSQAD